MGRRDFGHREPKKTKKDAKKLPPVTILPTPVNVELIRKKRKEEPEDKER